MAAMMIGIDPHKGSHTAVAIDESEQPLGELRVRSSSTQVVELRSWAKRWPERIWAVEGAGGLGYLVAQQLLAAGERVVDIQPKLGARVRLLATGATNKNDPNDARSVAIAALRSTMLVEVVPEDHATVLKLWAKRARDLGRLRTQVVCRLHAVLAELTPGGFSGSISAAQATTLLEKIEPQGAIELARYELAHEFLADLTRIDEQMRQTKKRITVAVAASGTTVTEIYGVGPFVAAVVIGYVRDVSRFSDRDHFAAYNGTAPIEVSSGNRKVHRLSRRGNRRINHAIHIAAVTQIRHRDSEGRTYYDKKITEGKSGKEALRSLKRRISDALFTHLQADARAVTGRTTEAGPGGQMGNDSVASATGLHPNTPALRPSHSRTQPKAMTRPAPPPSRRSPAVKKVRQAS